MKTIYDNSMTGFLNVLESLYDLMYWNINKKCNKIILIIVFGFTFIKCHL